MYLNARLERLERPNRSIDTVPPSFSLPLKQITVTLKIVIVV